MAQKIEYGSDMDNGIKDSTPCWSIVRIGRGESRADLNDDARLESANRHVALYVSGTKSKAVASGYHSSVVAAGLQSVAETHGRESPSFVASMQSVARTFGDYSVAVANWIRSHCTTEGKAAHAVCCSELSHAKVTGENSIAVCLGRESKAYAECGGAIVLSHWDSEYKLLDVKSSMVGQNGVKAGHWYALDDKGRFVEVEAPEVFELDADA